MFAGRPPKDGVYKPERLAALYGVKLDKLPEKAQSSEPWNEVPRGECCCCSLPAYQV